MQLTEKQTEAQRILSSDATHCMLFGGSRSGKTFLLTRNVAFRALKAPGSRHAIFRFRLNHIKASIVLDTFPKVMRICFPGIEYALNKTDLYADLPGGSQIWFAGLDDKDRTEKILGLEFVTEYFNECSQIPAGSVDTALTRLAQRAYQSIEGAAPALLKPRAYYDCVSGDTVLDGHTETVKQLAYKGEPITVLTSHGWRAASAPWVNGCGPMLSVRLKSGRELTVTPSHRFWVRGLGWTRADALAPTAELLCTAPHLFPGGVQNAPRSSERRLGFAESCYRCLRQCGGQLRRAADGALAFLASAYDAARHSLGGRTRDESGSRTAHRDPQEVPRNHHTQVSRVLPWRLFGASLAELWRRCAAGTCALFQRRHQSHWLSPELAYLRLPVWWRFAYARQSSGTARFAPARRHTDDARGTQWRQSSQLRALPEGQISSVTQGPEWLDGRTCAMDTPDESNGWYETAACIVPQPAQPFYTLEVPSCLHYAAHGLISHNCNPPSKAHWTYKRFVQHIDPETKLALPNPQDYASFQINPADNQQNLSPEYLRMLETLPARMRARFLEGRFGDANPAALFPDEHIDRWRVLDGVVPDMVRIVVAVDPSGADDVDNADNDEIGIVVAGLGTDGAAYVLEDLTLKAGPATWGRMAVTAFERHSADVVVGETNYGGAMVGEVIRSARPRTPFKKVTASRGKVVRAEPFSALYEQGKVRHVGLFAKLEDELAAFSTAGFTGDRSPNRADALIWALAELFPAIVADRSKRLDFSTSAAAGVRM